MDFNSPIFLFLFLPVFMLAYYLAPGKLKKIAGILGCLLFYAWGNLVYIPLILGLALLAYLLARGIERWRDQKFSAVLLWGGIAVNVLLIIGFKLIPGLAYPLGLSFLTFQVISYLVEVYNKVIEPEKNALTFFLYILLFPKIPVGPITRYRELRDQIRDIHIEPQDAADGLRRFIRGFAKKVLIADTLAKVVTPVFALTSPAISPSTAWLVLISYALQLYFDFSGYTDMAIGLGRMMGFRFVENFNFPYISKSIGDFWRRWHISLSSWFRDTVFYPLERRRLKWNGQRINILVVFILTGLWHGLTINFVIWGLIHGLALVFESTPAGKKLRGAWAPIQHLYALGVILAGWVFFRSPTPGFALNFLQRLSGNTHGVKTLPFNLTSPLPFIEPTFILALVIAVILSLPLSKWFEKVLDQITADRIFLKISFQFLSDLVLICIFFASVAAMAGATFMPGIYGNF